MADDNTQIVAKNTGRELHHTPLDKDTRQNLEGLGINCEGLSPQDLDTAINVNYILARSKNKINAIFGIPSTDFGNTYTDSLVAQLIPTLLQDKEGKKILLLARILRESGSDAEFWDSRKQHAWRQRIKEERQLESARSHKAV